MWWSGPTIDESASLDEGPDIEVTFSDLLSGSHLSLPVQWPHLNLNLIWVNKMNLLPLRGRDTFLCCRPSSWCGDVNIVVFSHLLCNLLYFIFSFMYCCFKMQSCMFRLNSMYHQNRSLKFAHRATFLWHFIVLFAPDLLSTGSWMVTLLSLQIL